MKVVGDTKRTSIVAANTLLFGLENLITFGATFATSVAIGRTIGPNRLGYYNYIYFLASVAGTVGTLGLPMTARKFMAEYLSNHEPPKAKAVYAFCFRLQLQICVGLTILCLVAAWLWSDPSYMVTTALIILGMPIRILSFLPSMANEARNHLRSNLHGSVANVLASALMTTISLVVGWDLVGVAAGILLGYTVELIVKASAARRWLEQYPIEALPEHIRSEMFRFSKQGVLLTVLAITVFDRSDLVFLRSLTTDRRDMTFFTTATSMVERLLVLPVVFTNGLGVSIMNDYSRQTGAKAYHYLSAALKYSMTIGAPILFCGAALSGPLIRLLWGQQYLPVIPLFSVAAALVVPKIIMKPAQTLLQAHDRQDILINWGLACAALNVALDLGLIPLQGAMGAILANGVTQAVSSLGMWYFCVRKLGITIEVWPIFMAVLMGFCVSIPIACAQWLHPGWIGALSGALPAVLVGVVGVRWLGLISEEDVQRISPLTNRLPRPFSRIAAALLRWECTQA